MLLKTSVTDPVVPYGTNPLSEAIMSEPLLRSDGRHALRSGVVSARPARRDRPLRIAFYSHDTMGMGHIRRNLLIASSLVRVAGVEATDSSVANSADANSADANGVEALLVAGTREAAFFAAQAGLDCVTLPALTKDLNGTYTARHLNWSMEQTVQLRSRIIAAALDEFRPDLLVVDKIPLGIGNELASTLRLLKSHPTRCVLGLRDVLDEPQVVAREWLRDRYEAAIESYYDEVWIYGDRAIYDCVDEYKLSSGVASRAFFTGYLNQSTRTVIGSAETQAPPSVPQEPFVLCVVGGGQDGFALAEAFVQSALPAGWRGVVITGPFMPKREKEALRQLLVDRPQMEIIDRMVETDDYMRHAERVVAMGGYNTITSVLSFGKPALIVPRTRPRREQWIRAERLAQMGLLSAIEPDGLTPMVISNWLKQTDPPRPRPECVDLFGLSRINARVKHLCAQHQRSETSSSQ